MQFSEKEIKSEEPKVISLLGEKVRIKQYLPMEEKTSLLEMVVQTADAGTIVNTLIIDAIFETYLVFKYTDIEFTDSEKADILKTFDKLEQLKIIPLIINNIPESEYILLRNNLLEMLEDYKNYRNSFKCALDTLLLFAPDIASKVNSAISELDLEKTKEVVNIAKAAGMR